MNYTYPLRQKVAVLLIVSLLNLLLIPVATGTGATLSAPVQGPSDFIRRISLKTNDLVYSSTLGKLYASVPSSVGSGGNSITTIDPATGAVETSVFVGSEPNKLALSDDGHSLYVNLNGAFAIRRFDVSTQTPGMQFSVGQDSFFGRYSIQDLAVAPGKS